MSPEPDPSRPASDRGADAPAGEFLLRLCHDLRSCLRSIQPHTEMLLRTGQSDVAEEFERKLGFVLDGTRRLDALLDGLAAYAIALQVDGAGFRPIALDSVLRNALLMTGKRHPGIASQVISGILPRVSGDADRLRQIFEILIAGALHRATGELRIQIDAQPHAAGWLISVKDHGAPLAADDLETMFRPFARPHHRSRLESGLELATCRVIVERHGGQIWAETDSREGGTFRFTLPAIAEG